MDRESKAFGLSPKKVVDLLRIGSDTRPVSRDPERKKAEFLHNRLNEMLPVSSSSSGNLARKQDQMKRTIDTLAGNPIGNLLQNPKTDIVLIRKVKNYGKELSQAAKSEAEHHAANTIYYAAIANALVFHELRITKFSYKDLGQSFSLLSKEVWIPEGFQSLFAKASKCCQSKKTSKCRLSSKAIASLREDLIP